MYIYLGLGKANIPHMAIDMPRIMTIALRYVFLQAVISGLTRDHAKTISSSGTTFAGLRATQLR